MTPDRIQRWAAHLPDDIIRRCRRHQTQGLLYTCAAGSFIEASDHKAVRPEPIDEHILIYCYSGEGYYTIDDITHTVTAGEFFVIPAGVPHEYGNTPGKWWTILWVHFAGTHAYDITQELCGLPNQLPCPRERVVNVFNDLLIPLTAGWNDANLKFTNHILWHFLGLFSISACVGLSRTGSDELSVSERVIALFNEDLSRPMSLPAIARSVGLSASHLSAVFKAETGASPIDYLIRQRIIEAARLLQTSHLRIGEISSQVGYEDTKFFSKTFRRIMGLSPRAYRQRHASRV